MSLPALTFRLNTLQDHSDLQPLTSTDNSITQRLLPHITHTRRGWLLGFTFYKVVNAAEQKSLQMCQVRNRQGAHNTGSTLSLSMAAVAPNTETTVPSQCLCSGLLCDGHTSHCSRMLMSIAAR